jgi:hypothetical protein
MARLLGEQDALPPDPAVAHRRGHGEHRRVAAPVQSTTSEQIHDTATPTKQIARRLTVIASAEIPVDAPLGDCNQSRCRGDRLGNVRQRPVHATSAALNILSGSPFQSSDNEQYAN